MLASAAKLLGVLCIMMVRATSIVGQPTHRGTAQPWPWDNRAGSGCNMLGRWSAQVHETDARPKLPGLAGSTGRLTIEDQSEQS